MFQAIINRKQKLYNLKERENLFWENVIKYNSSFIIIIMRENCTVPFTIFLIELGILELCQYNAADRKNWTPHNLANLYLMANANAVCVRTRIHIYLYTYICVYMSGRERITLVNFSGHPIFRGIPPELAYAHGQKPFWDQWNTDTGLFFSTLLLNMSGSKNQVF